MDQEIDAFRPRVNIPVRFRCSWGPNHVCIPEIAHVKPLRVVGWPAKKVIEVDRRITTGLKSRLNVRSVVGCLGFSFSEDVPFLKRSRDSMQAEKKGGRFGGSPAVLRGLSKPKPRGFGECLNSARRLMV